MQSIKLKSGNSIPVIGLGTWQLLSETCYNTVKNALELGYNHIDTAEAYENQREIGLAMRDSGIDRSELFITSKVWRDNLDYYDVIKSCDSTLKDLRTDYVDLLLIHWPNKDVPLDQTIAAMAELYRQEKIKSFGVSNFTIAHLKEAIPLAEKEGLPLSVNQVEFHPYLNQKELLDFCRENGITLTAYSPLGRGRIVNDNTLKKVGEKHGKSSAQAALRWLLQKGMVAIPKTGNEAHLKSNLELFDFELSDDEMEEIDSLNRDERILNPEFAEFDRQH